MSKFWVSLKGSHCSEGFETSRFEVTANGDLVLYRKGDDLAECPSVAYAAGTWTSIQEIRG